MVGIQFLLFNFSHHLFGGEWYLPFNSELANQHMKKKNHSLNVCYILIDYSC